jgi:hypothetical protein
MSKTRNRLTIRMWGVQGDAEGYLAIVGLVLLTGLTIAPMLWLWLR